MRRFQHALSFINIFECGIDGFVGFDRFVDTKFVCLFACNKVSFSAEPNITCCTAFKIRVYAMGDVDVGGLGERLEPGDQGAPSSPKSS